MVVAKRDLPYTPDPPKQQKEKQRKEYSSPLTNRTPLRLKRSTSRLADQEASTPLAGDLGKERAISPFTKGNDSVLSSPSNTPGTPIQYINSNVTMRRSGGAASREALGVRRRNLRRTVVDSPGTPKAHKVTPQAIKQKTVAQKKAAKASTIMKALSTNLPASKKQESQTSQGQQQPSSGTPQKLSTEQRNKMFEEWIKIAADNKINSKNMWNVALIDYFSEITFLRDGDGINFQKASCTLDGCVKIYSTRVDSVVDETGKLLVGLSEGSGGNTKKGGESARHIFNGNLKNVADYLFFGLDDGDETDKDGKGIGSSKKRPSRAIDTLEKSFEALNYKENEASLGVDPLFKKTCSAFDEGAEFLQMMLPMTGEGMLLFDSHDAPLIGEEGDLTIFGAGKDGGAKPFLDTQILVDLLGDESGEGEEKISEFLHEYSFDSESKDVTSNALLADCLEKLERIQVDPNDNGNVVLEEDYGEDEDDAMLMEDDGYDDIDGDDAMLMEDDGGNAPMLVDDENSTLIATNNGADGGSPLQASSSIRMESSTENIFAHFDAKVQGNWAGPEHWKIKKIRTNLFSASTHHKQQPGLTAKKANKLPVSITFDTVQAPSYQSLFIKAAKASTITLTQSAIEGNRQNDHLLPHDIKFHSKQLLSLFTRPKWSLCRTAVKATHNNNKQAVAIANDGDAVDTEISASYWNDVDDIDDGGGMPIHDDDDDDNYPPDGEDPSTQRQEGQHDIGSQLIQTYKLNTPDDPSSFSQRNRHHQQIDIHALKSKIWTSLQSNQQSDQNCKKAQEKVTKFTSIMDRSNDACYSFICLLHLANEHGLELSEDGSGRDLNIRVMAMV